MDSKAKFNVGDLVVVDGPAQELEGWGVYELKGQVLTIETVRPYPEPQEASYTVEENNYFFTESLLKPFNE